MTAPLVLEALDVFVPLLFILTYFLGKMQITTFKGLFKIWLVGLICGLSWELSGCDGVWEYPNYSFYIYDGIPLALPFAWAWWFMLSYLISQRLTPLMQDWKGAKPVSYYLAGVWFANIESFAVVIGWWKYTYAPWFSRPWPLVSVINGSPVHIMVYLGWGILTVLGFLLATSLLDRFRKRWHKGICYLLVVLLAAGVGVLAWFTVGTLTCVLETFAKTIAPF